LPAGPGGTRRRQTVTGRSRTEAIRKLNAVKSRSDAHLPQIDGRTTVAAWLQEWCQLILPGTVQDDTARHYAEMCDRWIVPHIGSIRLVQLGPEHVHRMMRTLEAQGLGPRTITLVRAVLVRALGQALKWEKVSRNAAALVDRPRAPARLDDALSVGEATAVLEAVAGARLEAVAVVVLTMGLRQGELIRLRWADVELDGDEPYVRVVRSKTAAGVRMLGLPAVAVRALRSHRAGQAMERLAAPYWHDPGLVFTNTIGAPLTGRTVLDWWYGVCKAAGIPRRRFHATRHTAATLMLNNGVPLEVVSKTLGHAGYAITADVYAAVGAKLQRGAADTMDRVLG
jgi:integrase